MREETEGASRIEGVSYSDCPSQGDGLSHQEAMANHRLSDLVQRKNKADGYDQDGITVPGCPSGWDESSSIHQFRHVLASFDDEAKR